MELWDRTAIVGIGTTDFSRNSGRTEFALALEACKAAIEDAGVPIEEVDGITRYSLDNNREYSVAQGLGLCNLRFTGAPGSGGNVGPGGSVLLAAMAVHAGLCNYCLVFRALNERSGVRFGQSWAGTEVPSLPDDLAYMIPFGLTVAGQRAALRARRHMAEYGTQSRHFGMISVACRKHANRNPRAFFYDRPLTLEEHQSSRMVADPLRLYDYCLESDGAAAVLVTTAERARQLRYPPAYILSGAWGSSPAMTGLMGHQRNSICIEPGVQAMARDLYGRAGIQAKDIKVAQIYDHFTPQVLMSIEMLGFCAIGEGGPFVENGRLEWPSGDLILNTSGGHLGEGYVHGMNLVCEAVRQVRGTSTSQVEGAELSLMVGGLTSFDQSIAGFLLRR